MSVTYYYTVDNGQTVTSAGTSSTSGNTLNTDEMMLVGSGSTVSAAVLQTSSVDLTGSGTAVTNPGGSQWVYKGGSITGQGVTQPLTGGAALVTSGGNLDATTVDLGGGVMVLSGGTANGTVLSGGFVTVMSGGATSGTVTSGGNENIYNGGTASGTAINSGGGQEVYSGGVANLSTVGGYGVQEVWSGGTANSAAIEGGGTQIVHAGGGSFASSNVDGTAQIYGFELSGTVMTEGVMTVMSGGNAESTFLTSGGIQVISAGGVGTGVNLEVLGTQTVMSGGVAYNTYLTGGVLNIQSGGIATIPVLSAGEILVSAGGVVSGASASAGTIEVLSGGTANGSVLTGGQQILMSGGIANGTHILSGGSEVVVSGKSVNPIIYAGGSETVYTGAEVDNVVINGAGTLSLESGAIVVGDVVFGPAGGRLQLLGTSLAAIKVDGLAVGDSIDFNNLSGTVASYSNGELLVYSNGPGTAAFGIALGTAPDGTLVVTNDGHGGSLVSVTAFTVAGAVAAFQSSAGLPGGALIADSAANVNANIDALGTIATAGALVGVTLTDSSAATLSITAAQSVTDAKALADISGNFFVGVDASAANATVTGVSGHATVVTFTGSSSEYSVAALGDGASLTVTDTGTGRTSVDHISGVTALHFSDFTEIVATASHAAGTTLSSLNIVELYSAALNREPDVGGLVFYETAIKANPTLTGVTVAEYFLSSSEYTTAHAYAQTSTGDTQFVSDLYTNVLHRTGSAAEISFYTTAINSYLTGLTAGTAAYSAAELQAHAQVLEYFSASAEFLSDIQITAQHPASASHWLQLI
jgi:autotransporter passenger strand-loop-strand repeat protein